MKVLRYWVVLLATSLASGAARADLGVQVGPRAGVAFGDDVDPYVGLDVRLTAPSSPLTLQPTFDYVFDEKQTLYHIGGNLLYEVPVAFRLKPYFGVGVSYSTFALNKPNGPSMLAEAPGTADDEGHRLSAGVSVGFR
jgi:Outer membrane protein beta-barrel domain